MSSDKNSLVVHNRVRDNSSSEEVSGTVIKDKPQRKWTSYIWDTLDKSPEERRFLFKLDLAVLTFASLGKFPLPIPMMIRVCNDEISDFWPILSCRILHQEFGPTKYQQCLCLGNERGLRIIRKPTQLHGRDMDSRIRNWRDTQQHHTHSSTTFYMDSHNRSM